MGPDTTGMRPCPGAPQGATRDGTRVPSHSGATARRLFEKLEGIRVSLVQDNGTKQTTFVVEQMDGVQSTMLARLGLDQYIVK